jgi:hypothetical protein
MSNAKTQEKQQDREILAMSWYTHHCTDVGTHFFLDFAL